MVIIFTMLQVDPWEEQMAAGCMMEADEVSDVLMATIFMTHQEEVLVVLTTNAVMMQAVEL